MKKAISLLITAVILFSMASCGTKNEPKEKEVTTITVMAYREYIQLVNTAAANFQKNNEDVRIEIKDIEDFKDEEKMMENWKDNADIVLLPGVVSENLILNYEDNFESMNSYLGDYSDMFDKNRISPLISQKKLKAIPINMEPVAFYYRKDKLKELNMEDKDIITWNDILNANKGSENISLGVTLKGQMSVYYLLMNQLNCDYVDEKLESTLDSEESLKVINLLRDLNKKGMLKIYENEDELLAGAENGEIFAFLGTPQYLYKMKDKWDKEIWDLMKVPAFEPGGNRAIIVPGENMFLLSSSKNKELAAKFMIFMSGDKDTLLWSMKNLYLMPAYKPIYKNEIFDSGIAELGNKKVYRFFETIIKNSSSSSYNLKSAYIEKDIENNIKSIIENQEFINIIKGIKEKIDNMLNENSAS